MERNYDEKIHERIETRTSYEDLCVDGTFKRCNRDPMTMCIEQRVFFTNSRRITIAVESFFDEHGTEGRKFGKQIVWFLMSAWVT